MMVAPHPSRAVVVRGAPARVCGSLRFRATRVRAELGGTRPPRLSRELLPRTLARDVRRQGRAHPVGELRVTPGPIAGLPVERPRHFDAPPHLRLTDDD